jgi:hypothetical protein
LIGKIKKKQVLKFGREPMCIRELLNKNEAEKQTFQAVAQLKSIKAVIRNPRQYCLTRLG